MFKKIINSNFIRLFILFFEVIIVYFWAWEINCKILIFFD